MKLVKILLLTLLIASTHASPVRLKEIIDIKGVRSNPVIGYGLVIGLNGSGDGGGEITNTSLKRMFQKLGLNTKEEISSKNVAAVILTAKLPPFARLGQKIDITVSSIGNASSLAGGTLLVSPLKAGDGNIYAIASGSVSIGGLKHGKKFATTGRIPGGGTVEREVAHNFDKKKAIRISLKNPDFTTSARVEKTINQELGGKYAISKDAATVDLIVPLHYHRKIVQLISIIENFKVITDRSAKIIINERTGTVVVGGDVKLSPVAISHKNLSIQIGGDEKGGKATEGSSGKLYYIKKQTTLNNLVKSLNAFGVTSEDLITIFQALKKNGALTGEIELI